MIKEKYIRKFRIVPGRKVSLKQFETGWAQDDELKKAGKEMRAGDIARLSGLDKTQVDKAIKTLNGESRVFSPKRCFWQVK